MDRMTNSIENSKPENSLTIFWEECTSPQIGSRISEMHVYLSYVAWYVNIYEAGPSASYDKFLDWLRKSKMPYNMGQDDVRWIKDVKLTKTFLHFLTSEERTVLSDMLTA